MVSRLFSAAAMLLSLAASGAMAAEMDNDALSGVYSTKAHITYNELGEGDQIRVYDVEDSLVLSRYGSGVYFHFRAFFDYGHTCEMYGVAAVAEGYLVFREDGTADGPVCTLKINRLDDEIVLEDEGGHCRIHCGARGSIGHGFLRSTRQPIEDMDALRAMPEYLEAVADYAARNTSPR